MKEIYFILRLTENEQNAFFVDSDDLNKIHMMVRKTAADNRQTNFSISSLNISMPEHQWIMQKLNNIKERLEDKEPQKLEYAEYPHQDLLPSSNNSVFNGLMKAFGQAMPGIKNLLMLLRSSLDKAPRRRKLKHTDKYKQKTG